MVEGASLPHNGTCKHYRHSYRWLRFPCCGECCLVKVWEICSWLLMVYMFAFVLNHLLLATGVCCRTIKVSVRVIRPS